MIRYDFGLAWEWEYDRDFINLILSECLKDSLTIFVIDPKNYHEVHHKVEKGDLSFRSYLDRAGDTLDYFSPLTERVRLMGAWLVNRAKNVEWARDKATMHLEFLTKGLHVPFTVILSPYDKDSELRVSELEKLGRPFIIKPACGGGGIGVVMGAENLFDVIEARKEFRQDKYLLQRKIIPKHLGSHRAWFRSFYVCGQVISCWWDDQTHLYSSIAPEEKKMYKLSKLKEITQTIAEVSELNFFSTEIAIDKIEDAFTVVDYVNEPCDMRLKSRHPDGVPDDVVHEIIQALLSGVKRKLTNTKKRDKKCF